MNPPRQSPILALQNSIAASAFNIAPERAVDLAGEPELSKLSLAISDDRGFRIRVDTSTQEVTLPIASLEYLWSCAYLFWILYQEYTKAQSAGDTQLDLSKSGAAANALDVFNWARRNLDLPGQVPWPQGPRPLAAPAYGSAEHASNELFLSAVAWIIHHEIAHVRTKDSSLGKAFSIQEERDCDHSATDWITAKCNLPEELQKRHMGMVAAIMAMQYLDEPQGSDTYVGSHPKSVERLHYCLDKACATDDSAVCAFAAVALQLHAAQLNIQTPLEGTSIRDILAGLQIAFATEGRYD